MLSPTLSCPSQAAPARQLMPLLEAVSGSRKGPGSRITFNTCQAEEDRDDATLNASFLFADFQEEECPTQNLPLCKASSLPSSLEVRYGLKDSLEEEKEEVVVKELSQFPTLLICLVAAGLLLFLILAIVFTIVIRRRQRSGIHHVQKS